MRKQELIKRITADNKKRRELTHAGYSFIIKSGEENIRRDIEKLDATKTEYKVIKTYHAELEFEYHELWTRPKYTKEELWQMLHQWEEIDRQCDNEQYTTQQIRNGVTYD